MDDAEARDILRARGETPTERGKLSAEARARATRYASQSAAEPGAGDYRDGVTPEDFGPDPVDAAEPTAADTPVSLEPAEPPAVQPEQRPRRPKRGGYDPGKTAGRFRNWTRQQAKHGGRPAHKRVPVDALISSMWAAMGGLAGNVDPPLGRVLAMQAPVAGLILEDVVRGTAADKVLQPIARAEAKAEKVLALAAPPAIVAALEASARLPEPQMRARQAVLVPLLERSLVLWIRIAGDKVELAAQRQREEGPAVQQARELIALIWPQPDAGEPAGTSADRETVGV